MSRDGIPAVTTTREGLAASHGETQAGWLHPVPRRARPVEERLNLTFRRAVAPASSLPLQDDSFHLDARLFLGTTIVNHSRAPPISGSVFAPEALAGLGRVAPPLCDFDIDLLDQSGGADRHQRHPRRRASPLAILRGDGPFLGPVLGDPTPRGHSQVPLPSRGLGGTSSLSLSDRARLALRAAGRTPGMVPRPDLSRLGSPHRSDLDQLPQDGEKRGGGRGRAWSLSP